MDSCRSSSSGVPERARGAWTCIDALLAFYSGFVVSTACAGFALGSGEEVALDRLAWTAAGTWGAAACANTLNQARRLRQGQDTCAPLTPCR